MRRLMTMAAILLTVTGSAEAGRLCRDSKGLFTPCIGERPPAEPRIRHYDAPAAQASGAQTASAPARPKTARASARPPLVAKARLCRDGKGLFTPCLH